jgi:hypothetical protein
LPDVVVTLLLTHLVASVLRVIRAPRNEMDLYRDLAFRIQIIHFQVNTNVECLASEVSSLVLLFEFDFGTACVGALLSLDDDVVDLDPARLMIDEIALALRTNLLTIFAHCKIKQNSLKPTSNHVWKRYDGIELLCLRCVTLIDDCNAVKRTFIIC